MTHKSQLVVAVLGIDGSGKSTLSRRLAEAFGAAGKSALIGDEATFLDHGTTRDLGPLLTEHLRRRVADRAHHAKTLAEYKIPKIAELLLRDRLVDEVAVEYSPAVVLVDGMPALNLTAWANLYRHEHFNDDTCCQLLRALTSRGGVDRGDPVFELFPELGRLADIGYDHMRLPDAAIFLDVPPAVCVERIARRGKDRQVHETTEKLAMLRAAYLRVCAVLERDLGARVLVLEGDRDADVVLADARAFVDAARSAPHGH